MATRACWRKTGIWSMVAQYFLSGKIRPTKRDWASKTLMEL